MGAMPSCTLAAPAGQETMTAAQPEPWAVAGSCKCGKVKVWQRRPGGLMNIHCHCSNCRKAYTYYNGGKYSTVSVDWLCNLKREGKTTTSCTCAKGIFCLQ